MLCRGSSVCADVFFYFFVDVICFPFFYGCIWGHLKHFLSSCFFLRVWFVFFFTFFAWCILIVWFVVKILPVWRRFYLLSYRWSLSISLLSFTCFLLNCCWFLWVCLTFGLCVFTVWLFFLHFVCLVCSGGFARVNPLCVGFLLPLAALLDIYVAVSLLRVLCVFYAL